MGYFQQPAYPERLGELASLLDAWIQRAGDIDFVVHGGDLADAATPENIRLAGDVFRLSVPTYACLGNHDMTSPTARADWLSGAGQLFAGQGDVNFSLAGDGWAVHIMPNHWCDEPYYWEEAMDAYFLPNQLLRVEQAMADHPGDAHVIVTHSAVLPIPTEQTGMDAPYHDPGEAFTAEVGAMAERHGGLRAIFSGHSHLNMHVHRGGVHYVTVSSLVEVPFEFKVVELSQARLAMQTVSLAGQVSFDATYDCERSYVQGRAVDRGFDDRFFGGVS